MEERHVVTCFLRNDGAVLLLCRSDDVGSYAGRWGAVAGHAEGDPDRKARTEIREETGLDPDEDVELVRRGDPFAVVDEDRGTRWQVHPYLFDSDTRTIEPNWETTDFEWAAPTAILHRETVPDLWQSYDRVRPTPESIASDRSHGSAYLSIRALDVLRDESGIAAERAEGGDRIASVARDLLAARPSMAVLANRVNRVLWHASEGDQESLDPRALEHATTAAINHAVTADRRAAERAAEMVADRRVATLSRSGTVLRALETGDPAAILVAESRPGREGVTVAERLAAAADVTLTTDTGFAHGLSDWNADVLLVGADSIHPDDGVLNKVGTRGSFVVSSYDGVESVVVAATDKIAPNGEVDFEPRDGGELYEGTTGLSVRNPTFDLTPLDLVDAVVTESGTLDESDVERLAATHRKHASWS